MKKDLHPTYYSEATITCACGNVFTIGSTKERMEVEVCSHCHPFYTGQDRAMDRVGRIQKFKERVAAKQTRTKNPASAKTTASKQAETKVQGRARVTTKAKK